MGKGDKAVIPERPATQSWTGVPVLVTGGTGRIGRCLVRALLGAGAQVRVLTRDPERAASLWPDADFLLAQGDLCQPDTLDRALQGIERVFHLASPSAASGDSPKPSLNEHSTAHQDITAEGTAQLLAAALKASVKRLLFFSSVKAIGETTDPQSGPIDETKPAAPTTAYGRAKLAAEQHLLAADRDDIAVSVLRLPMVYGPGVDGNVARIVAAVARHRFPPWPRLVNHRSAIHVEDAVTAALLAAEHPNAVGRLFLVTDGLAYSTRWIYEQACLALGRPVPHWTVPLPVLWNAARLGAVIERGSGRPMPLTPETLQKLTADAWYDACAIGANLGFSPRHRLGEEIQRLAANGPG
jgi:nucleoside-diphosphate-sugar epimerase